MTEVVIKGKHWRKEESQIVKRIWKDRESNGDAMEKIKEHLPYYSESRIRSKIIQLFPPNQYEERKPREAKRPELDDIKLDLRSVNYGDLLENRYKEVAKKYGAEIINGVLMKNGKRVSLGELVNNNQYTTTHLPQS